MENFLFLYCRYCFMFYNRTFFKFLIVFLFLNTKVVSGSFITFQQFSCGFDQSYIFPFFTKQKSEKRNEQEHNNSEYQKLQQIVVYKVQLGTLSKCSPSRRVLHTQQSLELLQLSLSQYYSSHTIHTKYDVRRFS